MRDRGLCVEQKTIPENVILDQIFDHDGDYLLAELRHTQLAPSYATWSGMLARRNRELSCNTLLFENWNSIYTCVAVIGWACAGTGLDCLQRHAYRQHLSETCACAFLERIRAANHQKCLLRIRLLLVFTSRIPSDISFCLNERLLLRSPSNTERLHPLHSKRGRL